MKDIYLLGDSVLKGIIYRGELGIKSYALCSSEAVSPLTDRGYAVTNRSRMGATSAFFRDNLEKLLPQQGCDGVRILFGFGGNDSDYDWQAVSDRPEGTHAPNTPPEDFCRSYRETLERTLQKGGSVAVANLIPIDPERYFNKISRGRDAEAIRSWLGDVSMLYRWQEYYNLLVERTAAACGCPLVDIRSAFLRSHRWKTLLSDDGIHPTEEGHLLIRQTLAEALPTA